MTVGGGCSEAGELAFECHGWCGMSVRAGGGLRGSRGRASEPVVLEVDIDVD